MIISYEDYLEINNLLVEIENYTSDIVIKTKIEKIARILEERIEGD